MAVASSCWLLLSRLCACAYGDGGALAATVCGWCPFKATNKKKGHCINLANWQTCPLTNATIIKTTYVCKQREAQRVCTVHPLAPARGHSVIMPLFKLLLPVTLPVFELPRCPALSGDSVTRTHCDSGSFTVLTYYHNDAAYVLQGQVLGGLTGWQGETPTAQSSLRVVSETQVEVSLRTSSLPPPSPSPSPHGRAFDSSY
jgi:hypothetical protein